MVCKFYLNKLFRKKKVNTFLNRTQENYKTPKTGILKASGKKDINHFRRIALGDFLNSNHRDQKAME